MVTKPQEILNEAFVIFQEGAAANQEQLTNAIREAYLEYDSRLVELQGTYRIAVQQADKLLAEQPPEPIPEPASEQEVGESQPKKQVPPKGDIANERIEGIAEAPEAKSRDASIPGDQGGADSSKGTQGEKDQRPRPKKK